MSQLPQNAIELIPRINQVAMQAGLANNQIAGLINWVLRFKRFYKDTLNISFNEQHLEGYLNHLMVHHAYDSSQLKNVVKKISFFYIHILGLKIGEIKIPKPQRQATDKPHTNDYSKLFPYMQGTPLLMVKLATLAQLSLNQVTRIRLVDLCLKRNCLRIRGANNAILKQIQIPLQLCIELRIQSLKVKRLINIQVEKLTALPQANLLNNQDVSSEPDQALFVLGSHCNNPLAAISFKHLLNEIKLAERQLNLFKSTVSNSRSLANTFQQGNNLQKELGFSAHLGAA
ncbi:phage integrase N-terminal SAM-like domain-containing protein [Aliikangiella sp. IMCC44653]